MRHLLQIGDQHSRKSWRHNRYMILNKWRCGRHSTRYSTNHQRRNQNGNMIDTQHRYPILKESSETQSIFYIQQASKQKRCSDPLGTQGIIGDAINIQYSA